MLIAQYRESGAKEKRTEKKKVLFLIPLPYLLRFVTLFLYSHIPFIHSTHTPYFMNPQIVSQGYQPQHQRQTSSGTPYVPSQQISAEAQYQQQFHLLPPMNHPPPPLQHHHEHAHAHQQPMQQAHLHLLQSFWMSQMHDVENVPQDFKLHHLPLARIKKVMKTDEDVKVLNEP